MEEIKQVRVTVAINAIAAIVVGWISVYLASLSRSLVAGVIGIVIMIVVGFITQKAIGNRDRKFWLTNGVIVFLLVWFVSWTVFHNIVF